MPLWNFPIPLVIKFSHFLITPLEFGIYTETSENGHGHGYGTDQNEVRGNAMHFGEFGNLRI